MTFYSDMAVMANELMVEFGSPRELVLTRETPTGTEEAPGTPVRKDYTVSGVVNVSYLDSREAGKVVLTNKRSVVLSVYSPSGQLLNVSPQVGDTLTFDGAVWSVDACAAVSPGGYPIIFKLDVSK